MMPEPTTNPGGNQHRTTIFLNGVGPVADGPAADRTHGGSIQPSSRIPEETATFAQALVRSATSAAALMPKKSRHALLGWVCGLGLVAAPMAGTVVVVTVTARPVPSVTRPELAAQSGPALAASAMDPALADQRPSPRP